MNIPVFQRFRPPPVISPSREEIPGDLALLRGQISGNFALLAPLSYRSRLPTTKFMSQDNILVFRRSYQESFWHMVWQFIWQSICGSQNQYCLIFSKVGVDFQVKVYYSFATASLILLCLFNIAKYIDYLVGDTSLRLIQQQQQRLLNMTISIYGITFLKLKKEK